MSRQRQTKAEILAGIEARRIALAAARREAHRIRSTGAEVRIEEREVEGKREKVFEVHGARKDAFQLLLERRAIEQAAFDAIRRYETDVGMALGHNTPERRPDYIRASTEGAPGQGISQAMILASRRVKWIEDRLTDRQLRMLKALSINVAAQWRAIVQTHTGETHDVAHAVAVRAMADAIRHGYIIWDREVKKVA